MEFEVLGEEPNTLPVALLLPPPPNTLGLLGPLPVPENIPLSVTENTLMGFLEPNDNTH